MTVLRFFSKIISGNFQEKVGNLMALPLGNLPGPRQLIYTLIERILMEYIIKNRKNNAEVHIDFCKDHYGKQISLRKLKNKNIDNFINEFISNITLGDAEKVLSIENDKFSKQRNNLMHSKEHFKIDRTLSKSVIHNKNKVLLKIALDDLIFVFNRYSDLKLKLVESENTIVFC